MNELRSRLCTLESLGPAKVGQSCRCGRERRAKISMSLALRRKSRSPQRTNCRLTLLVPFPRLYFSQPGPVPVHAAKKQTAADTNLFMRSQIVKVGCWTKRKVKNRGIRQVMQSTYRQFLSEYIAEQAKPIEKYGHQPRLYALSCLIGEGSEYDDDVLFAAAWLHDLGVFIGHRPQNQKELSSWDHVSYVISKAPMILASFHFPETKIIAVLEAIRTHQPQDEPTAIEGVILRDADILEQLGAVGIMRTVCKIGRDDRFVDFTSAVRFLQHSLQTLPSRIRLARSRQLAEPKIRMLGSFLAAIVDESHGALF